MKKYILLLLIAGVSVTLTTSCLKKYLDKAPEQGLSESQIFTKLDNFKLFFDGVYNGMQLWNGSYADYNIKSAFPWYWDCWDQKYSQESVTDAADMGRYMEGHAWKSGNMSETIVNKLTYDGVRNPVLQSMFYCIRVSNIALMNVSKIEDGTAVDKDDLRGQAYFIRALSHFTLFQYWGPMPYLTKPLGPTDVWDIPRLSKHETCIKIAQDFDSAYFYFNRAGLIRRDPAPGVPGHGSYDAYQMYRPNGMAALGYKSRALLTAASPLNNELGVTDWQVAAKASWDALKLAEDNGVTLLTFANRYLNYWGNDVSDEDLWSYSAGNLNWNMSSGWRANTNRGSGQTFMNGIFGNSTGSNSGICPTQNFVDNYETIFGEPLNTPADRAAAAATVPSHYNEQDPFTGRDPRLAQDIIYNQSPCQNYTSNKAQIYISIVGGVTNYSELLSTNAVTKTTLGVTQTGYYLRKGWYNNSTKNTAATQIWTDPLCRLAEMYLNYAEAANEAYGPTSLSTPGATKSALDAINQIRARAGMPAVLAAYTADANAFRPRIKNERNVELAFEGFYRDDIIRWAELQQHMSATIIGNIPEKLAAGYDPLVYPTGFKYTRAPLSADRQPVWKPQMYYLPFNNADALKMKNFVPNPVW
jgi:starch-binding outer membrane protein, SusD/RagB family